jgi:hypothetical protein
MYVLCSQCLALTLRSARYMLLCVVTDDEKWRYGSRAKWESRTIGGAGHNAARASENRNR